MGHESAENLSHDLGAPVHDDQVQYGVVWQVALSVMALQTPVQTPFDQLHLSLPCMTLSRQSLSVISTLQSVPNDGSNRHPGVDVQPGAFIPHPCVAGA